MRAVTLASTQLPRILRDFHLEATQLFEQCSQQLFDTIVASLRKAEADRDVELRACVLNTIAALSALEGFDLLFQPIFKLCLTYVY
jgi:hypothetical protein